MAIGAGEDMAEEAKAKGEGCVLVEGQSKDRNAQLWLDINPLGKQLLGLASAASPPCCWLVALPETYISRVAAARRLRTRWIATGSRWGGRLCHVPRLARTRGGTCIGLLHQRKGLWMGRRRRGEVRSARSGRCMRGIGGVVAVWEEREVGDRGLTMLPDGSYDDTYLMTTIITTTTITNTMNNDDDDDNNECGSDEAEGGGACRGEQHVQRVAM
eukprot:1458123-Rhodomonas_salina.2